MNESGNVKEHAHRAAKSGKGSRRPVSVKVPNPLEWRVASEMAGGTSRLFVADDGVIIANSARRPQWLR